ncbi:MAG: hypothetical protein E6496_14315, partial [Lachnoanaerobaculum sp.]|nr:hypothetical protein [Lachnoanaerobaculum sp.]
MLLDKEAVASAIEVLDKMISTARHTALYLNVWLNS